ncbi:MAG: zf-HC2 domain-containing protein [Desulfosarcina sp.]|nr:zf-HC2 domain-containing protein [Desulfobacterales bacterium]
MGCAKIRRNLSGYIENELDANTMNIVEQHLFSCNKCKEAFNSMHILVQDLSVMESVKAPDDFLDRLHDRIKKDSGFNRLARKLFLPPMIKVPFQFAAAAAMAVLIFFIVHTPAIKDEMKSVSTVMHAEKKAAVAKDKVDKDRPVAGHASIPVESEAVDEKPALTIELALLLNKQTPPARNVVQSFMERKAESGKGDLKSGKRISSDTDAAAPAALHSIPTSAISVGDINKIVHRVQGRILAVEYNKEKNSPELLMAEIPANKYGSFLKELRKLGKFLSPPPSIPAKKPSLMQIEVKFLSP